MLTIFTTSKPFLGHYKIIQTNAIRSWLTLHPSVEVILFGNEEGYSETAADLGIRHIPDIRVNEYGTPLVDYMFDTAQELAANDIVGFVSTDIILMSNFIQALRRITVRPFLMVGRRWDVKVDEEINFDDTGWEQWLRNHVAAEGRLHPPTAIDYFIFNRGLYRNIPPFAMGRAAIDNWLIYRARAVKAQVFDATRAVTAIHQNHDTSFKVGDTVQEEKTRENYPQGIWDGPERTQNIGLMGGTDRGFTIEHATRVMTPTAIRRPATPRYLYFRLSALPVLHRNLGFLRRPMRLLTGMIIAVRRLLGISGTQS